MTELPEWERDPVSASTQKRRRPNPIPPFGGSSSPTSGFRLWERRAYMKVQKSANPLSFLTIRSRGFRRFRDFRHFTWLFSAKSSLQLAGECVKEAVQKAIDGIAILCRFGQRFENR